MKLLIAGSRDIDKATAMRVIDEAYWFLPGFSPDTLITGDARGVDTYGQEWWLGVIGGEDTIEHYPAEWDKFGKKAGFIRNEIMALEASQAILVWDGESRGTADMRVRLVEHGVTYVLVTILEEDGHDKIHFDVKLRGVD